jgi:surface-anchored protein
MKTTKLSVLYFLVFGVNISFAAFTDNYVDWGHVDIGVAYGHEEHEEDHGDDGDAEEPAVFEFHVHAHASESSVNGSILSADAEFEPGNATIGVPNATRITAQNNSFYNTATGTSAGDDLWVLPFSETSGVPYLGIATEELVSTEHPISDWSDVTFTLNSVTHAQGNGVFSLYETSASGTSFHFSSASGASVSNQLIVAADAHTHWYYAFSEAGDYEINLTASVLHDGATLSDTATFAFNVVPEPSTYALLIGISALGFCIFSKRNKVN